MEKGILNVTEVARESEHLFTYMMLKIQYAKGKTMDIKEKFLSICRENISREGIEDLLKWLEGTDFFTAPASTRFHGSYPGGLLEHSLNVYEELQRILDMYPEIQCSKESATICSLFHDFCKINFYKQEKRNRKVNGVWESYDSYAVDEQFQFGGHGSKSVYLIQHFMDLTPEEAVAINCHMGAFDNPNVGGAFEQFPFAWALHVADEAASYIREGVKKNET